MWDCISSEITDEGLHLVAVLDENGNKYISIADYNGSSTNVVIPSSINVDGENISVKAIADNVFYDNETITSIIIPDSVTTVGSFAFYGCFNLTTITIGENSQLTTIGESAFDDCSSLTSIYIPNSVTTISSRAFYKCSNLETVTFGENSQLTTIGDDAFYNCDSLTSIYIPDSVTFIDHSVFSYCSNLIIYCEASSEPSGWDSDWNVSNRPVVWSSNGQYGEYNDFTYGVSIDNEDNLYINITGYTGSSTNVVIPSLINVDGENIPVKAIADNAFYKFDFLTSMYIPDSVTTIGSRAFCSCTNLTTVTISENSQLNTIEDSAFSSCSSLTSIYIPSSVTTIGSYAFNGCFKLTIYCETSSQPSSWDSRWNESNRSVIWDVTYEQYLEYISE